MIILAAVDNRLGMMFFHKRLSRDSVLNKRLMKLSGHELWGSAYTKKMLPSVHECSSLREVPKGAYVFVEDPEWLILSEDIEGIYLFHWNVDYPLDGRWNLPMGDFRLVSTDEFAGTSHECITEEYYVRK